LHPKLTNLDLVAWAQHARVHKLAIDVGSVGAAYVDDAVFMIEAMDLGVAATDSDVVKKDVAGGMATRGRTDLIEYESGPDTGPTDDGEHRLHTGWQTAVRGRIVARRGQPV